jgi:phage I-like protein
MPPIRELIVQDENGELVFLKTIDRKKNEAIKASVIQHELGQALILESAFDLASLKDGAKQVWLQLSPYGVWKGHPNGPFDLNQQVYSEVEVNFKRRERDTVVDYEHATLSGSEAPAAGWISRLRQESDGLWGLIKWNANAREKIEKDEYRYLSPVFIWSHQDNRSGKEMGCYLHSVALTNSPFLDGQKPVHLTQYIPAQPGETQTPEEVRTMEITEKLQKELGLAKDSKPEEIVEKVVALKVEAAKAPEVKVETKTEKILDPEVIQALGMDAKTADTKAVVEKITALTAKPDEMQKLVTGLSEETRALKAVIEAREQKDIEAEVDMLIKDGKILPAQKETALSMAKLNIEMFRKHYATACKMVVLENVAGDDDPTKKKLGEAQTAVNKELGISLEDHEKFAEK